LLEQHANHPRAEVDERADRDECMLRVVARGPEETPHIVDAVRLRGVEPEADHMRLAERLVGWLELEEHGERRRDHAVTLLDLDAYSIARAIEHARAARAGQHVREGGQLIQHVKHLVRLRSHERIRHPTDVALTLTVELDELLHAPASTERLVLLRTQATGFEGELLLVLE
jgi:hypothetical protein